MATYHVRIAGEQSWATVEADTQREAIEKFCRYRRITDYRPGVTPIEATLGEVAETPPPFEVRRVTGTF